MHKKSSFLGWENSHIFTIGDLEIVVVPAIGARLMSLRFKGVELLRVNSESAGKIAENSSDWMNWGGDFDWYGPQASWNDIGWPPPYEIDSAPWDVVEVRDDYIELASQVSGSGISLVKNFCFSENAFHSVKTIKNNSDNDISCGLWNITQVNTEGNIYVPVVDIELEQLKLYDYPPVENIKELFDKKNVFMADYQGRKAISFSEKSGFFKVGLVSDVGDIIYEKENVSMRKSIRPLINGQYPHGCNIEIFRDSELGYTEIEHLWLMKNIYPGGYINVRQDFSFY